MLEDCCAIRAHARLRRARLALVFALVSGAALVLAACGGGGGGGGGSATPKTQFTEVADLKTDPATGPFTAWQYTRGPQRASYALGLSGASSSGGVGAAQGQGVSVAILDGEMDVDHPDLSDSFARDRAGNALGRNVAEQHNDVRPIAQRYAKPRPDIQETASPAERREAQANLHSVLSRSISHATHVAGIVAARNNGFGTVGIAPRAKLVPVTLFRDYDRPVYRGDVRNLNSAGLANWNRDVAEAVDYAARRNAFVLNNSWGFGWYPTEIETKDRNNGRRYFYRLPNFFLHRDSQVRADMHRRIFDAPAIAAWERAVRGGAAIVFAAGNDGWNSETGRHKIYSRSLYDPDGSHRNWVDYRHEDELDTIKTRARRINVRGAGGSVDVPANIPSLESSYFLTNEN